MSLNIYPKAMLTSAPTCVVIVSMVSIKQTNSWMAQEVYSLFWVKNMYIIGWRKDWLGLYSTPPRQETEKKLSPELLFILLSWDLKSHLNAEERCEVHDGLGGAHDG